MKINISKNEFELKLKVADLETPIDIIFPTLSEITACVELLRDETNTFYNPVEGDIHIVWEPVGENDPKFKKLV